MRLLKNIIFMNNQLQKKKKISSNITVIFILANRPGFVRARYNNFKQNSICMILYLLYYLLSFIFKLNEPNTVLIGPREPEIKI